MEKLKFLNYDEVKPRLYQEIIAATAIKKNTLCILPTGMGKTLVAILVVAYRLEKFSESIVEFNNSDIITASDIKKENPKRSMTDCIGYAVSLRLKIKFMTGDKEFEYLENVEFIR